MQELIDKYDFSYRNVELDCYNFPVRGFKYVSKSEILSTAEFLKQIKVANKKAKLLDMEVYFSWVELLGINGKCGVDIDSFIKLYGGNRYLDKGKFIGLIIEIRAIDEW